MASWAQLPELPVHLRQCGVLLTLACTLERQGESAQACYWCRMRGLGKALERYKVLPNDVKQSIAPHITAIMGLLEMDKHRLDPSPDEGLLLCSQLAMGMVQQAEGEESSGSISKYTARLYLNAGNLFDVCAQFGTDSARFERNRRATSARVSAVVKTLQSSPDLDGVERPVVPDNVCFSAPRDERGWEGTGSNGHALPGDVVVALPWDESHGSDVLVGVPVLDPAEIAGEHVVDGEMVTPPEEPCEAPPHSSGRDGARPPSRLAPDERWGGVKVLPCAWEQAVVEEGEEDEEERLLLPGEIALSEQPPNECGGNVDNGALAGSLLGPLSPAVVGPRLPSGPDPSVGSGVELHDLLCQMDSARAAMGKRGSAGLLKRNMERLSFGDGAQRGQFSVMQFSMLPEGTSSGPMHRPPFPTRSGVSDSFGDLAAHVEDPETCLDFSLRRWRLLEEILRHGTDVVVLQGCDHFADFFEPALGKAEYVGAFHAKESSAGRAFGYYDEGLAIFWKRASFSLVCTHEDECTLAAHLRHVHTGDGVLVASAQLLEVQQNGHEQARQAKLEGCIARLQELCAESSARHVVFAGDLNNRPEDVELCARTLACLEGPPMASVYPLDSVLPDQLAVPSHGQAFTVCRGKQSRCISDYVLHSAGLECVSRLALPHPAALSPGGLPCLRHPSDHLSLVGVFRVLAPEEEARREEERRAVLSVASSASEGADGAAALLFPDLPVPGDNSLPPDSSPPNAGGDELKQGSWGGDDQAGDVDSLAGHGKGLVWNDAANTPGLVGNDAWFADAPALPPPPPKSDPKRPLLSRKKRDSSPPSFVPEFPALPRDRQPSRRSVVVPPPPESPPPPSAGVRADCAPRTAEEIVRQVEAATRHARLTVCALSFYDLRSGRANLARAIELLEAVQPDEANHVLQGKRHPE